MLKVFFLLFLILKKEEEGAFSSLAQQIYQKLKIRVSNQKAFMATQCDSILQEKKYEKNFWWGSLQSGVLDPQVGLILYCVEAEGSTGCETHTVHKTVNNLCSKFP